MHVARPHWKQFVSAGRGHRWHSPTTAIGRRDAGAHGIKASRRFSRPSRGPELAEGGDPLRDRVVLVDRLLARAPDGDRHLVGQVAVPLEHAAEHLAHDVLDEPRALVRDLDELPLVGPLEHPVRGRADGGLDDVDEVVRFDVVAPRLFEGQRRPVPLVVGDDRHAPQRGVGRVDLPDRLHRARAGGHPEDLHADRLADLDRGPAARLRAREEGERFQARPSEGRPLLEEVLRRRADLPVRRVLVLLEELLRDPRRHLLERVDRVPDALVDDLADRLEVPRQVGAPLVPREVDEDVEARREGHRAARSLDLDRLRDAADPDPGDAEAAVHAAVLNVRNGSPRGPTGAFHLNFGGCPNDAAGRSLPPPKRERKGRQREPPPWLGGGVQRNPMNPVESNATGSYGPAASITGVAISTGSASGTPCISRATLSTSSRSVVITDPDRCSSTSSMIVSTTLFTNSNACASVRSAPSRVRLLLSRITVESHAAFSRASPSSTRVPRPSTENGRIAIPTTWAPPPRADSARTGAAPVPVPPPRPHTRNTMSRTSRTGGGPGTPRRRTPPGPGPRPRGRPSRGGAARPRGSVRGPPRPCSPPGSRRPVGPSRTPGSRRCSPRRRIRRRRSGGPRPRPCGPLRPRPRSPWVPSVRPPRARLRSPRPRRGSIGARRPAVLRRRASHPF